MGSTKSEVGGIQYLQAKRSIQVDNCGNGVEPPVRVGFGTVSKQDLRAHCQAGDVDQLLSHKLPLEVLPANPCHVNECLIRMAIQKFSYSLEIPRMQVLHADAPLRRAMRIILGVCACLRETR